MGKRKHRYLFGLEASVGSPPTHFFILSIIYLFIFVFDLPTMKWDETLGNTIHLQSKKTNICRSSPLSLPVFFLSEMSSSDQRSPLWSPATVPEDLHAFWRRRSLISHKLHQCSYSCDFHRVGKPKLYKVSLALVNLAKAAIKVTSIWLVSVDVVSLA